MFDSGVEVVLHILIGIESSCNSGFSQVLRHRTNEDDVTRFAVSPVSAPTLDSSGKQSKRTASASICIVCSLDMCGIIAIYEPQTPGTLEAKSLVGRIDESLEYIAHRGPDATGVWVSDDASCGE